MNCVFPYSLNPHMAEWAEWVVVISPSLPLSEADYFSYVSPQLLCACVYISVLVRAFRPLLSPLVPALLCLVTL